VADTGPVRKLPLTGFSPVHPPVATQLVVLSAVQDTFAAPPGSTEDGFNAIVNRGLAIVAVSAPNAGCTRMQAARHVVNKRM
jgi:hypothetical protein